MNENKSDKNHCREKNYWQVLGNSEKQLSKIAKEVLQELGQRLEKEGVFDNDKTLWLIETHEKVKAHNKVNVFENSRYLESKKSKVEIKENDPTKFGDWQKNCRAIDF